MLGRRSEPESEMATAAKSRAPGRRGAAQGRAARCRSRSRRARSSLFVGVALVGFVLARRSVRDALDSPGARCGDRARDGRRAGRSGLRTARTEARGRGRDQLRPPPGGAHGLGVLPSLAARRPDHAPRPQRAPDRRRSEQGARPSLVSWRRASTSSNGRRRIDAGTLGATSGPVARRRRLGRAHGWFDRLRPLSDPLRPARRTPVVRVARRVRPRAKRVSACDAPERASRRPSAATSAAIC